MPQRYRLYDFRVGSTGPQDIGLCANNLNDVAASVNAAEQRLILCREASDEGWHGTWAEIAFTVSQTNPYLTTPRNVARIEAVNLCNRYIPLNNQFAEYMRFGNGRLPKLNPTCRGWPLAAAYTRNSVPTFMDLTNPPQLIAAYATDPLDIATPKRVLIQGLDNNNNVVYSQDVLSRAQGVFLTLSSPFAITAFPYNQITGIQKDITNGPVQFFQVDPNTGAQVLLLTMDPSEQSASYRRYYFNSLPFDCCCGSSQVTGSQPAVTITAICKLDPIPVMFDTDYLNLQGAGVVEAIIQECQAIRYSKMDSPSAKSMQAEAHKQAVGILNGILNQYLGKDSPAVNFKPFGSARLSRKRVGMI